MKLTARVLYLAGSLAGLVWLAACGSSNGLAIGVTTLAGAGESGNTNATGAAARFNNPVNMAIGPADGLLYVCDFDNGLVRRVTPAGVVTTLVQQAGFERPFGICFGPDGNLYVETDANDTGGADSTTGTVWRVNTTTGAATVVARNIGRPRGLCPMPVGGGLLMADLAHHVIQRLDTTSGQVTLLAGAADSTGFVNGDAATARFSRPYGVVFRPTAAGANPQALVADQDNSAVRSLTFAADGSAITAVATFAGGNGAGLLNGTAAACQFNRPQDVDVDSAGNIYVADSVNHVIRRIDTSGQVTTLAGNGVAGFADGPLLQAQFFGLEGLAVRADGVLIYVPDGTVGDGNQPYNRIRAVRLAGG